MAKDKAHGSRTGLWFSAAYDGRTKCDVRIFGAHGPIIGRLEVVKGLHGVERYGWHFTTLLGRKMNPGIGERTVWSDITGVVIDNYHAQVGSPSPAPVSRIFRVGTVYEEKFPAPARRYKDVSQYGLDLGVLVEEYGNAGWTGRVYVSSNGSPLGNRIRDAVGTVGGNIEAFDNAAAKLHAAWEHEFSPSEPN